MIVVGSGLFGSAVARAMTDAGGRVLVIEKREHIGGNCWSFRENGIDVHAYGPHVLHTDSKAVWDWFCSLTEFSPCMMSPIANFRGELYNLPFNMNTFYALWGVRTPQEAKAKIASQRIPCKNPSNLEEHVLDVVGVDVYEKLVKGYTEKQYGKPCSELPVSLIRRMPLLFTFDNDYSHVRYQGVPRKGWPAVFESLLEGIDIELDVNYLENRDRFRKISQRIVFTGGIDAFYDYQYGPLEYRGRRFKHKTMDCANFQGCSLMNFTDKETPHLRTIEHKHFSGALSEVTVVTYEYATGWHPGDDPYYTVNDEANQDRYDAYMTLAVNTPNVFFGGRLGEYRYYDMQDTVKSAWALCHKLGIRLK